MIDKFFYKFFGAIDNVFDSVINWFTAPRCKCKKKKMRDTKVIENFIKENYKKIKEMSLFRDLKKEVETGANGTQDYVIKEGQNKGKKANVK